MPTSPSVSPLPASRTEPGRLGRHQGAQLQHPLHARRHRRTRPSDPACAPDLVLRPGSPALLPVAQEAGPAGRRVRPGDPLRRGARRRAPPCSAPCGPPSKRTEDVLLPLTPGLHRRGFATAVVRFGGARLGVLSCHLSLQNGRAPRAGRHAARPSSPPWAPRTPSRAATSTNDPNGRTFRRLAARAPGRLGRRALGRRAHLDARGPRTSASTRSSPRRASRSSAAGCRSACPE